MRKQAARYCALSLPNLDQARERQAHLDTLRQQREATQVPVPPPQGSTPPATVSQVDVQAVIQQAVQQALAV